MQQYMQLHSQLMKDQIERIYNQKNMQEQNNMQLVVWTNNEIVKCEDSNLTFLTDPKSPYHTIPSTIAEMFGGDHFDPKIVRLVKTGKKFQPVIGDTHICTRIFPNGTHYYTCKQCCCQTKPGTTMCFCEQCWEEEKHVGHNFKKVQSTGGAYCDCGREERIKPESFCRTHADKSDKHVSVGLLEEKQFTEYFHSLLVCYFYLKINQNPKKCVLQLQTLLHKQLESLCTASLYYIRLTTKILTSMLKIGWQNRSILEWLLKHDKACEKMIFALMGDNQFKLILIRTWGKLEKEGWQPENLRLVISQMYETDDVFFALAKEGHFLTDKKKRYLGLAQKSEKGQELFAQFIKNQKQKLQPNQWPAFLRNFFQDDSCTFLHTQSQIVIDLLTGFFQCPQVFLDSRAADAKNVVISEVSMLIFSLANGKIENVPKLYQTQVGKDFGEGLDTFLMLFAKNLSNYLLKAGQKKETWCVVPLSLLAVSPKKHQILQLLWANIFEVLKNGYSTLSQGMLLTYKICALVAHSSIFFNSFTSVNKVQAKIQTQLQKQEWIKSFLYENSEIPKVQILKLRQKSFFKFPNAGKLLRSLCNYVPTRDSFLYVSEQKYQNYLMRFKTLQRKQLACIPDKNFRISDQYTFADRPWIQQIFTTIFSQQFGQAYFKEWQRRSQLPAAQAQKWKQTNIGYYYLLTLVYINTFIKGTNEVLKARLTLMTLDLEERKQVYQFCSGEESCNALLDIKDEAKEEVKEQGMADEKVKEGSLSPSVTKKQDDLSQQTLAKIKQKRQKLRQKFQRSTQKFLQKNIPQKSQHQDDHSTEKCIICRCPSTPTDSLMYISNFDKNISIAFNLHGSDDKSQISILSCLHLVHSSCFAGINKSGFDFNCPLCSRKSNIYLPYNLGNRKALIRCGNLINSIEVTKYKNYDFNSLVFMLIKYLMGSYGLNSLISNEYFQKQKIKIRTKKIDEIILELAQGLANRMSEDSKKDIEEDLAQLEKQLLTCKKQEIRLVQEHFLYVLYNKIVRKENRWDQKKLQQMRQKIVPEQYAKIVQITSQLCQTSITIPQPQPSTRTTPVPKKSINISTAYPPLTSTCFTPFQTLRCSTCPPPNSPPIKYLCLLCSRSFCPNCTTADHHLRDHGSNYMVVDVVGKKVSIRQVNGKVNGGHHVYFDAFMTPYQDRAKYGSQEEYVLDTDKMDKLIASYLMRVQIK